MKDTLKISILRFIFHINLIELCRHKAKCVKQILNVGKIYFTRLKLYISNKKRKTQIV